MAYRRTTRRKASSARGSRKSYARGSRKPTRRTVSRARKAPRKAARKRAAPRAIRLELVQAAPRELSPVTQMLLDRQKITLPRRARF